MSNKFDYVKTCREDVDAIPENIAGVIRWIIKKYTHLNVWVFKKTNGRLMKNWPGGYPICVVGMTGAKSGKRREAAVIYLPRGENAYLVASQGGMEVSPMWYHNIKVNPDIDLMVAGKVRNMRARLLTAEEKRECWPYLLSIYPDYDEYQARTDRDIPVFICEPV